MQDVRMNDWLLLIDESGRLEDPDAKVAVGAVLVADPQRAEVALRREICALAVYLLPPFHRALAGEWLFHAIHIDRFVRWDASLPPPLAHLATHARAVLGSVSPEFAPRLAALVAICDRGAEPDVTALSNVQAHLRAVAPAASVEALRARTQAFLADFSTFFADLNTTDEGPFFRASGFAAAPAGPGAWPARTRYVALVRRAVGRVLQTLGLDPGQHALRLDISGRDLEKDRPVTIADFGFGALAALAPNVHRDESVVSPYAATVHPAIQLADWLAYEARHVLNQEVDAAQAEADLETLGVPLSSGLSPPYSHLAGLGTATPVWAWVEQVRGRWGETT